MPHTLGPSQGLRTCRCAGCLAAQHARRLCTSVPRCVLEVCRRAQWLVGWALRWTSISVVVRGVGCGLHPGIQGGISQDEPVNCLRSMGCKWREARASPGFVRAMGMACARAVSRGRQGLKRKREVCASQKAACI
eukprot:1160969-Pelagomonas_calceolata.AAC.4